MERYDNIEEEFTNSPVVIKMNKFENKIKKSYYPQWAKDNLEKWIIPCQLNV